jgi:hypothetical protein
MLLIAAAIGPRLVVLLVALFSDFFEKPFDGFLIPFLGFLFLPWTTLAYAWAINSRGEVAGLELVIVIVAVLIDIGLFGGGEAERRKRAA